MSLLLGIYKTNQIISNVLETKEFFKMKDHYGKYNFAGKKRMFMINRTDGVQIVKKETESVKAWYSKWDSHHSIILFENFEQASSFLVIFDLTSMPCGAYKSHWVHPIEGNIFYMFKKTHAKFLKNSILNWKIVSINIRTVSGFIVHFQQNYFQDYQNRDCWVNITFIFENLFY